MFVEGFEVSLREMPQLIWDARDDAKRIFPEGINLEQLTERQKIFIADQGAAIIYKLMRPEVELLATSDSNAEAKIDDVKKKHSANDPEYKAIIMDFRERLAMTKIQEFLKIHRGERVALVFGAAHV